MRDLLLAAALGIAAFGDQAPVRELIAGLTSGDAVVRAKAACELKDQGDRAGDAIDSLVRLLGDATPVSQDVCRERWWQGRDDETTPGHLAAAALVGIGSGSVPALIAALQQPQWISRRTRRGRSAPSTIREACRR
jgi:HEAT repeat protein